MFIHDNEKENDAGKHAKNRSCPRLYWSWTWHRMTEVMASHCPGTSPPGFRLSGSLSSIILIILKLITPVHVCRECSKRAFWVHNRDFPEVSQLAECLFSVTFRCGLWLINLLLSVKVYLLCSLILLRAVTINCCGRYRKSLYIFLNFWLLICTLYALLLLFIQFWARLKFTRKCQWTRCSASIMVSSNFYHWLSESWPTVILKPHLKGLCHQFRIDWKWYHWIGLG
jgi:hypothetical protein